MKKHILSQYSLLMLTSLVLLPGCALLDSLFGAKKTERAESSQERALNKDLQDAAIEVLTEGSTVIPEEELTGNALVTMNGKPIVTTDSLQAEEAKLLDANPELKQMLAFMDPAQLRRNLAEGLMNQALVDQDITDRGIDKKSEYKKEIREGFKAVERMVNTKFFTQSFDVHITDADVRKFYDANKDTTPQLIISRGGIKAMGIPFDTEEEAQTFVTQVTAQGNDIKKAAQAAGIADRVKDFMSVNQQSMGIDADVKAKIVGITKFPTTQTIKGKDNKTWVITATSKEETQYRPFEQVKAEIKDYLEKEERAKKFDEEINKLKQKYNVKMDETFFAQPAEGTGLETELPEDLLSQLEEQDDMDTVAYHDRTSSVI